MKPLALIFFVFTLCLSFSAQGQKGSAKFGMLYKPIIPNRLIGYYDQDFNKDAFQSTVKQKFGHSLGMQIRIGLSNVISIETGLSFTQRNYHLNYAQIDSGYAAMGDVRVVSYEIPVSGLVYIRLGDDLYMSTSLGAALTFFPSDVRTVEPITSNQRFQQEGAYYSKVQGAMLANLGFEYRSKKSGTFYLGASYHLPFKPIMAFAMSYEYNNGNLVSFGNISGSYLTADIRYYFNEKKDTDTKK
jgi:hypothetical protein